MRKAGVRATKDGFARLCLASPEDRNDFLLRNAPRTMTVFSPPLADSAEMAHRDESPSIFISKATKKSTIIARCERNGLKVMRRSTLSETQIDGNCVE